MMRIKNTTENPHIPDYVLRRLVSWCCRQLIMPVNNIRRLHVRNRSDGFQSGHCWLRAGHIHISSPHTQTLRDRVARIVSIMSHEVAHRYLYLQGLGKNRLGQAGYSESATCWHQRQMVRAFEADREHLLDSWLREPAPRQKQGASHATSHQH